MVEFKVDCFIEDLILFILFFVGSGLVALSHLIFSPAVVSNLIMFIIVAVILVLVLLIVVFIGVHICENTDLFGQREGVDEELSLG